MIMELTLPHPVGLAKEFLPTAKNGNGNVYIPLGAAIGTQAIPALPRLSLGRPSKEQ